MKTVLLRPSNQKELNFLVILLERLKIPFDVMEEISEEPKLKEDPIKELFGSWKSDESGEELIKKIYSGFNLKFKID